MRCDYINETGGERCGKYISTDDFSGLKGPFFIKFSAQIKRKRRQLLITAANLFIFQRLLTALMA